MLPLALEIDKVGWGKRLKAVASTGAQRNSSAACVANPFSTPRHLQVYMLLFR